MAPEIELAKRMVAGEPGALESFLELFRRKVYQYSYLNCGQREDAEEVAQETMMRVCAHVDQLREPEHVKTWVFQIARNVCFVKRRKSEYAPSEEMSLDDLPAHWAGMVRDRTEGPDSAAYHSELRKMLAKAIHELPDIYRNIVLLRDLEEMSTTATAEILQVSEQVVKTRLHRARLLLRKKLEEAGTLSPFAAD